MKVDCPNCGEKISDINQKYCEFCGNELININNKSDDKEIINDKVIVKPTSSRSRRRCC